MLFEEYEKKNDDLDVFMDVSHIVNPDNATECRANIIYAIKEVLDLGAEDVYEVVKNIASSYYNGVAFEQ